MGDRMTYTTLMVHFDSSRNAERRLRLALGVAEGFQATLIGIAGKSYLPTFLADGPAAEAGADDGERQEMADLLARIGVRFHALAKHAKHPQWRGLLDYANNAVPNEARAADLVIIGRERTPGDLYFALDPAVVILRAGRPVLVVPDGIEALEARRVVVAWKDVREARRAVRDALPFLRDAQQVIIAEVCEHGSETQSQQQIDDVTEYLRRHDVDVEAKAYLRTEKSVAHELLRFAGEARADLIVAGGYGHSRLGEWMLGGVTRSLLSDSPMCCLFSH
jgi:nucleotide-binding universal stress UspA family protein